MATPPALILLGGNLVAWNQRFLHAARARGLAVLLVDAPATRVDALVDDRDPDDPGDPLAGVAEVGLLASGDVAAIVDRCCDWAQHYDVRGVCSLREDYVAAAAAVADVLGLPAPGLRAARVCRNKHLQRRYLAAWSPRSALVSCDRRTEAAEQWTTFPAIVKPVGRSASSGVRRVADAAELSHCLAEYPEGETLLVEERVVGQEYSVESLSRRGELLRAAITEKRTTERGSAFFVEMAHTTPPPWMGVEQRAALLDAHAGVLERLAFDTGIAHGEYRLTADGRAVLMEVAARPPGDSIMALHWLASGVPLEDALVALAVGESPAYPAARRFARQVYLDHEPGVLADLSVDPQLGIAPAWFRADEVRAQVHACGNPASPAAVRCVVGLKPAGTVLAPLRESADRAAMFVVDAPTPDALERIEARCRDAIDLRVAS